MTGPRKTGMENREVLLETMVVGNALRVAVVDAETGEEVVFQAPPNTPRAEIDRIALNKLARRLGIKPGPEDHRDDEASKSQRPGEGPGRGIIV